VAFLGPGVRSGAYVDPGNFATNISGGAQVGLLSLGSSWKLLKESTNILLESAPPGVEPEEVGEKMVSVRGVEEVHDLHVWMITSGFPALAAHVLVGEDEDCHERRRELEKMIYREFGIEHTTLQVDHVGDHAAEDKRIQFLPQIKKREAR
jgi:cobalt-zinc-cadmium efflux system protein